MAASSSASHPGPLALADVAQLLGQQALPDDTQLWVGEDGPNKALGDIVDVGDAGDTPSPQTEILPMYQPGSSAFVRSCAMSTAELSHMG